MTTTISLYQHLRSGEIIAVGGDYASEPLHYSEIPAALAGDVNLDFEAPEDLDQAVSLVEVAAEEVRE